MGQQFINSLHYFIDARQLYINNSWHIIIYLMRKQIKASKSKNKQPKSKTKPVKKDKTKKQKPKKYQEQQSSKQQQQVQLPYSIQDQGLIIKVKIHKQYNIKKEEAIAPKIKNWFVLYVEKEKRKNKGLFEIVQYSFFPHFQFELEGEQPSSQKCSICQFEYDNIDDSAQEKQLLNETQEDLVTLKCSHIMHYGCLKMLKGEKQWIKCPVCSTIFGKMIGDQPQGVMNWTVDNFTHCDGYPQCGTISISYQMHPGKRGSINFPGTHRHAYLPDNKQGREVLRLLEEAFNRKLVFTVGRSVTTGRDNQIVWNGIHHKTNLSGGSAYFGYPDPTYFDRVKLELAAKGIN